MEFYKLREINSLACHLLFRILYPMRRLDPMLAEAVLGANPELAAAARRFPDGMASVIFLLERRRNPAETHP